MALPPKVLNAIKWYSQKHDLTPMLSAYPQMHFKNAYGEEIVVGAFNILIEYDNRKRRK